MYLWNHPELSAHLGFGFTNQDISTKSNNEDPNDVTKKFVNLVINQFYVPITILQSKCMTHDMPVSINEISSGAFVTRTVLAASDKSQHDYRSKRLERGNRKTY